MLTTEQKEANLRKMREGAARAREERKLKAAKATAGLAVRCTKTASIIDAIVHNGGDFTLKDNVLKTSARLLREAAKALG